MFVFVTLREKNKAYFDLELVDLEKGEHKQGEYAKRSLTQRVPMYEEELGVPRGGCGLRPGRESPRAGRWPSSAPPRRIRVLAEPIVRLSASQRGCHPGLHPDKPDLIRTSTGIIVSVGLRGP